ncbi:hypothetical protein BC941DRAFT_467022 [Chlamydoabsidia padenii]|nr:hypothetical protein BC941DRAFT_467022 [Chlamydoabsidia padenii]
MEDDILDFGDLSDLDDVSEPTPMEIEELEKELGIDNTMKQPSEPTGSLEDTQKINSSEMKCSKIITTSTTTITNSSPITCKKITTFTKTPSSDKAAASSPTTASTATTTNNSATNRNKNSTFTKPPSSNKAAVPSTTSNSSATNRNKNSTFTKPRSSNKAAVPWTTSNSSATNRKKKSTFTRTPSSHKAAALTTPVKRPSTKQIKYIQQKKTRPQKQQTQTPLSLSGYNIKTIGLPLAGNIQNGGQDRQIHYTLPKQDQERRPAKRTRQDDTRDLRSLLLSSQRQRLDTPSDVQCYRSIFNSTTTQQQTSSHRGINIRGAASSNPSAFRPNNPEKTSFSFINHRIPHRRPDKISFLNH